MSKNTQTAKGMLVIGTLLLAGCATPTLNFVIPKDKVEDFNKCMVPAHLIELGKNEDNKDDDKFWLNGLREFVPTSLHEPVLLTSLSESIPEILNMLYADKEKLSVPKGTELLRVPFDMHMQPFPYFDSRMVDVVEKIFDSVNLSELLEPENLALANSKEAIPGRIAKALKTYLLAYFTASPNTDGTAGFISRDGTTFRFPVEIDPTPGNSGNKIQTISSVDHSQVGADIIRIILEAIRDGSLNKCDALPAIDKSATGFKKGLLRVFTDNTDKNCKITWKIASEGVEVMQARANAAESMIATAAGKAMRGGSIGSLDNEALARAAETAIGVMARHTTERAEWCRRASVE